MGKRGTVLDWQMVEENAEWPPPSSFSPPASSRARQYWQRWRRWALPVLVVALLPALVSGYLEVRRADHEMTRIENEVRTVVTADASLEQLQSQGVNTDGLAPTNSEIAQTLGLEVRRVEVKDDYAMVEVWTMTSDDAWLPAPYRQTRFYQETPQGWLATTPPDAFYQPVATLQAGRFTFVYGPRDADAVLEAARQVEEVDADLRAELGLPVTDEALSVKVITDYLPSLDPVELVHLSAGAMLYAPSPARLSLPAHISEGDALLQLVAGLLVKRDLDEALAGSLSECEWQSLVNGLRLWLLQAHSDLPSHSYYDAETLLRYRLERDILPRLTWLEPDYKVGLSDPIAPSLCDNIVKDGVAAALVDYALSGYGRERLPALIDGIQRYHTWATLTPAVFGVSAAEFETGWQTYLEASYGGQSSRLSSTVP